jgi:hypothetical protein
MSRERTANGYSARQSTHPSEVATNMPQTLIVIFLLFFAVLAFGWFYLQRAKARTNAGSEHTAESNAAPAPTEHADHSH